MRLHLLHEDLFGVLIFTEDASSSCNICFNNIFISALARCLKCYNWSRKSDTCQITDKAQPAASFTPAWLLLLQRLILLLKKKKRKKEKNSLENFAAH